MGQKVHPYGFRVGYNKDWHSHWFTKQDFAAFLAEDLKLKRTSRRNSPVRRLAHRYRACGRKIRIVIYTSRPGIIIGRKGAEIEALKESLMRKTGKEVELSILEIKHPELNAQLQAEKIAQQLEKRIAFRRAMKKTMEESIRFGAKGIKVMISGRLNGAEIARTEWSLDGRLPLHTLRADIDFGFAEAHTTFGVIGVKVWIYRGEILDANASMARGTTTDPINEVRGERGMRGRGDRRPRRDDRNR